MNGNELVRHLAATSGLSLVQTRLVLENLRELLEAARLTGEPVRANGIGVWRRVDWKGRRVLTGGVWRDIPARTVLAFRPVKRLRGH